MEEIQGPGAEEWEVLRRFLPPGWREAARSCRALRRARQITDAETLLRVLFVHLAGGCSLQETAVRAREVGWAEISAVALFKRLQSAEEWLRWMASELWAQAPREPVASWAGARRVRAIDATTVREPGPTGSLWRVHHALELSSLQCDFFEVSGEQGGESFKRIPVARRDLLLGDRIYATPPSVAHVLRREADVLVRTNLSMLPLYTARERRLPILKRLRSLRVGRAGSWPAYVHHDGHRFEGRLVAVKKSQVAAESARQKVRRQASKQQRAVSEQAIEAAGYVFAWTSLGERELPAEAVLELYRQRWQIELAFKRMKSIMGFGQLPKRSDESARAWVHGKLLLALLLERLEAHAETLSPWGYALAEPTESVA